MAAPVLKLVDSSTGELEAGDSNALLSKIEQLEQDLDLVERALRKERAKVARLEADKDREREQHAQRKVIESVFAEWCEVGKRGKGTKLGPKRFDAIAARLGEGRERWMFSLAIYYTIHRPFEKDGMVYADIELACRDEVRFERAMYGCWRTFPDIAKGLMPAGREIATPPA